MFLFLIITQLFIRHKMMDLESCGLLWCIYQLFGLSFWRHPFAADDFSKYLQMKNKLIYILDDLCSRQCKRHSKYTWYSFNIEKKETERLKKLKLNLNIWKGFQNIYHVVTEWRSHVRMQRGRRLKLKSWTFIIPYFSAELRYLYIKVKEVHLCQCPWTLSSVLPYSLSLALESGQNRNGSVYSKWSSVRISLLSRWKAEKKR